MQYEIEIKVLLGEKEIADRFRDDIHRQFSDLKLVDTNSQLNHYFVGGNFTKLKDMLTERKVFENDET
ncbi:MAG: hypothetical protein H6767_05250 [Candidatus Peribacteria bacterium]|nr:MAG: hypothetical protein H6767_05250 [Candidatus Peribacteria bacterium]